MLVLLDLAFRFIAPHLFVQSIEKLLAGSGAGERCTVVERPAKTAEVEQPFGSAVEGHPHAVEQVNDARSGIAHRFHGGLVGEEIAAINRVVKVLPGRVAFALEVLGSIDATLRADRVRALYRHNRKQVHLPAHLGDLDNRGQARQSSAHHNDSGIR